ncbi:hypothetical protein [Streptomyces sp. NRRL F-5650]|uniref:hypothetical protein n=1 Tax=Streptomyces sp. NRRL F-5650 TaxID=1463868 RepID=UPI0004C8EE9E|nr:hypothetical protein [Streptomyces sp. NRRL F-5650]
MRAQDLPEALGKETRKSAPAGGRPAIGRPEPQSGHLTAPAVLALQRAVGNTAATRVVEESRHRHGAGRGHGRTGADAAASGTPTVQRAPGPGAERPKEQAEPTEWFNATTGKWEGGQPDAETMRPAHGGERHLLKPKLEAEFAAKRYAGVDQVPVYKVRTYRRTKGPGTNRRSPELRMLDRLGRLGMSQIRRDGTPHLATSVMPDGRLGMAGNTGRHHVTEEERDNVNGELADVQNEDIGAYGKRRMDKDLNKVRAMQAGDYFAGNYNRPQLGAVSHALKNPDWSGSRVGDDNGGRTGSQHAEMTLLGQHIAHWKANPRKPEDGTKTVDMGGVKLACAACQWAFEAANRFIGSKYHYKVVASGAHGMLFRNWIMPKWLADHAQARAYVEGRIKAEAPGARFYKGFDGNLVLNLPKDYRTAEADQEPEESESEWERI